MKRHSSARITMVGMLAIGLLAACTQHAQLSAHGSLRVVDNEVRITVPGAPDAYVQSGGGLAIGSSTLALTPAEQTLAQRYYQDASGLGAAGKATGEAGGRMGIAIIGSLFSALWHDDSSIIDRTAHRGAAGIKSDVQGLCEQLSGLRSTQDALASALPAFAPYRVIRAHDVSECFRGAERHGALKN